MPQLPPDPYAVLGVRANATDAEIRAAYRRAVQLHHPDHNNGSPESTRKFEEVQDAYARIRRVREGSKTRFGAGAASGTGTSQRAGATSGAGSSQRTGASQSSRTPPPPRPASDPAVEARLAALERELQEAQRAREQAEKEAREAREKARRAAAEAEAAAASARGTLRDTTDLRDAERRPSDEELGYVHTDDSFSKIIADAREQLGGRINDAREGPVGQRISDLIDELEDLTGRLTGEQHKRPRR